MKKITLNICSSVLAALTVGMSLYVGNPLFYSIRPWDGVIVGMMSLVLLCFSISLLLKDSRKKFLPTALIIMFAFSLTLTLYKEIQFVSIKNRILNSENQYYELIGKHFIVGYSNTDEIRQLIEKGAIGGIFMTGKNVKGKTKEEIRQEIDSLQKIQIEHGRPPLIISTDQEGGLVSRVSPPLQTMPGLSSMVSENGDIENEKLMAYATAQARELAEIGVNINFAPVVDINEGIQNENDNRTVIYKRAISDNPDIIGKVASTYCDILMQYQIHCTLKHFPGLGRVKNDTHLFGATLNYSQEELNEHEFTAFKKSITGNDQLIMLSHATATALDPDHPVSSSKKIIQDIVRHNLNFQGVLVTDDFSMGAVTNAPKEALDAMNAGVDLILISYDEELYYPVMDRILNAVQDGTLDMEQLNKSDERLGTLFR